MTQFSDRASDSNERPKEENPWVETVKTLGLSAVLAFGIRTFVAEARYIPTGSMLQTLQINDRLIVDKISYHFQDLNRGDIIVFNPTKTLKQENYKDAFIKRIVGLPGDTVKIEDGRVYINEKLLEEPYTDQTENANSDGLGEILTPSGTSIDVCKNKLPYFVKQGQGSTEVWTATVPQESYLVMGDNRNNSYDSRCWGVVAHDDVIGRAVVRFWPPQRVGGISSQPLYPDGEP
ncbi:MAG: signal peptidase I [Geitlerinemataceae cyanobacterium]